MTPPSNASLDSAAAQHVVRASETYELNTPHKSQLTKTFKTKADLQSSAWHGYFDTVYGVDTMKFPFSLADLNFFYLNQIPEKERDALVIRSTKTGSITGWQRELDADTPIVQGDLYLLYDHNHVFRCEAVVCSQTGINEVDTACRVSGWETKVGCPYQDKTARSLRFKTEQLVAARAVREASREANDQVSSMAIIPREGVKDNELIEIIHDGGDPPHMGWWGFVARGSGIYLNVGKTFAGDDHGSSWNRFCPNDCPLGAESGSSAAAANEGYDTIQYARQAAFSPRPAAPPCHRPATKASHI
jgi:hypothetical protein